MTLGIFMPMLVLAIAPIGAFAFLRMLRKLPDATAPNYDAAKVAGQARMLRFLIGWQFIAPVLFYLIFNVFDPDLGAMVVM